MAFSFVSRLKKRFKHKKHKKKEIKIDKITIDRIQKLKQDVSTSPEKDYSTDFSSIVRYFFMKLLKIKYHFTYEEFVKELKRKRLSKELKSELAEFFKALSNMKFMQEGYKTEDLNKHIQKFEDLIPRLLEEKHLVKVKPEHGFLSRLLYRFKIRRAVVSPKPRLEKRVPHESKLAKSITNLKLKFSDALTFKWLRKQPQDKLTQLYGLLGEGYEAISKNKIRKAESKLSKVDSIYKTLTTQEAIQIKKEVDQLRREISSIKKPIEKPKVIEVVEPMKKPKPEKESLLRAFFKTRLAMPKPTPQQELELPPPPAPEFELKKEEKIEAPIKIEIRKEQITPEEKPIEEEIKIQEKKEPVKRSFLKSLFKPKKEVEKIELPPPPPIPEIEVIPQPVIAPEISEPHKPEEIEKPAVEKKPVSVDLERAHQLIHTITNYIEQNDYPMASESYAELEKLYKGLKVGKSEISKKSTELHQRLNQLQKLPPLKTEVKDVAEEVPSIGEKKPTPTVLETEKAIPKPFKLEQPELEFYPQQPPKQKPYEKPAIQEQPPIEKLPTIQDISSLALKAIQKGESLFRPKPIFVPSYAPPEPQIEKTRPSIQKAKEILPERPKIEEKPRLQQPELKKTKPLIPIRRAVTKPVTKPTIEDLENMIQTAQHLIQKRNFSAAKDAYSKALKTKKALRLKRDDSTRISYDLIGIDVDLKLSGLTSGRV